MSTESMQRPLESPSKTGRDRAGLGLALVRVTIGSMFVWVFFENLGKGLYSAGGYAGLIHYYMRRGHAPRAWKAVMGLMADHAWLTAPLQGVTEISLGVLLLIGFFTRPAAAVAFLFLASLWVSSGERRGFGSSSSRCSLHWRCWWAGPAKHTASTAFWPDASREPRIGGQCDCTRD